MKTTPLPSVEERKEELRTYFDKLLKPKKPTMKNLDREILADWLDNVLTQDRNQAYTSLVKGIEGMKTDERKVATFGEWQAESYEDKMLVNAILTNILEKVVKPLYNKTGDN